MKCSVCGTVNDEGRKFCAECGAPLAIRCPTCGTENRPDAKFCGECGTAIGDRGAALPNRSTAATAPAPVTERKLVSVLFADLVGFTALSEARDPEEVRDLLTRYFELARTAIERYGGTVEKFIGDAVMAVWGTPIAREDDAERAVRAALELVETVAVLGQEVGTEGLQLRAGVVTGYAAVSLRAAGQGMVAGDLVNTASRLQASAPPGAVLVGTSTYRASRGAIAFEEAGEQALRGKALPVRAWRALRVVARRRGEGRTEALEAPFVGRDEEFRLLKESLDATERDGKCRLVSIVGQAGIGKSRLAWEFQKYIDGVAEEVYWHEGRSPAYGEAIAFWALGEMVRRRAGIAESDDAQTTREKLRAALIDYIPDAAERGWVEPRVAALLGVEAMPEGERDELFAAWRTFFERVADRGPTVLVFDELQWADDSLLDFIEHVLDWARQKPILVVTLARPELLERRPGWGTAQRAVVALHLEPLPEEEMRRLLDGLIPGLPDSTIQSILARAEGVPLYAVETVRMLVDAGQLVRADGRYQLAGELDRLQVPESLQALIAARLDALEPIDRSLLQDAAVLGLTFAVPALAAVSGANVERLDGRLRGLARKELVVLDADPRSPERGRYRFMQSLIREVAYGTLARRERRQRHVAAARYLESLGDGELAGVLASHYLEAYRAAPDGQEGEALAAQARVALRAAAQRAVDLHAHAQALEYLETAIAVTPAGDEQMALRDAAVRTAFTAGRLEAAIGYARAVLEWRRAQNDRSQIARGVRRLCEILIVEGSLDETQELLESTFHEMDDIASDPEVVRLAAELARLYIYKGDTTRCLEIAEPALVRAERLNLAHTIGELLATKGWAIAQSGRLQEGLAILRGTIPFADRRGLTNVRNRAAMNVSGWGVLDSPREAWQVAVESAERGRAIGLHFWAIPMMGNATAAAVAMGEWDWALQAATEVDREDAHINPRLNLLDPIVRIRTFRGEGAAVSEMVEWLERGIAASGGPQEQSGLLVMRAAIALAERRFDDAYEHGMAASFAGLGGPGIVTAGRAALWARDRDRLGAAVRAMDEHPLHGGWLDGARATLAAGSEALAGRGDEAVAAYQVAFSAWEELELPFELAMSQLEYVAFAGRDAPDADRVAEEARATFERLRASVFLEWLDEVQGGVSPASPIPEQVSV